MFTKMSRDQQDRILAKRPVNKFVGRALELDALADPAALSDGINLLGSPGSGVSEILRHTYDRLFVGQRDIIPFYFEFRASDADTDTAGRRFARSFLEQFVAFRRNDPTIIGSSKEIEELVSMSVPSDGSWVRRVAELCDGASAGPCFGLPARAVASDHRIFMMVDGLHELLHMAGGHAFLHEIDAAFSDPRIPFAFGSRRQFNWIDRRRRTLVLEPLSVAQSNELAEILSADLSVDSSDQTRDLIAVQMEGNPARIISLFEAAARRKASLASFREISSIYSDEIFEGHIGMDFDAALDRAVPDGTDRQRLLEFLRDASVGGKASISTWRDLSGLSLPDLRKVIEVLNIDEIVRVNAHMVESAVGDIVVTDCIRSRYLYEVAGRTAAVVKADLSTEALKRAPVLMARLYRHSSALGLLRVLSRFDCQSVPSALFDYGKFRDQYKGREHRDIVDGLMNDASRVVLPQLVYVDSAASFYPAIAADIEDDRAVAATGFCDTRYTDDDQIAWVAAEIDSKLEVSLDLAEEWCDRLNAVADHSGLGRRQLWLISPEGFSPEALDLLHQRAAFGSSRQQAILLNRFLDPAFHETEKPEPNEYEMIVPMGEDTELIAAHAVEEIARRHHFPQKAINQIKTALVEACINAVEHSLSPDRKIYQKFAVEPDKINIIVSNRGLRLTDAKVMETTPAGGRRGWGLSLMKGLMDEVTIERVDDGTRIRMTKFLKEQKN